MRKRFLTLLAVASTLCGALAAQAQEATSSSLAQLGADVSAVIGDGAERRVLLVEVDRGVSATRTLGVGDEYRDGWRIGAIAPELITLTRNGEVTMVRVITHRAAAQAAPEPAPLIAAASLTNAASVIGALFDEKTALDRGDFASVVDNNRRTVAMRDQMNQEISEGGPKAEIFRQFLNSADGSTVAAGTYNGVPAFYKVRPNGERMMVVSANLEFSRVLSNSPPTGNYLPGTSIRREDLIQISPLPSSSLPPAVGIGASAFGSM